MNDAEIPRSVAVEKAALDRGQNAVRLVNTATGAVHHHGVAVTNQCGGLWRCEEVDRHQVSPPAAKPES
jgi:hypothetical protein